MVETSAAPTTSAPPVITAPATRSFTSTQVPVMVVSSAVIATPPTKRTMRNHGRPASGRKRWVISQAIATAATQAPTRTNSSSALGAPIARRGTGGGASSSRTGRWVRGVVVDRGVLVVVLVLMRRRPPRTGCG